MKPTKPDRWERMADKIEHLCEVRGCVLRRKEVAALLRKEHAAVVRLVRKEMKTWKTPSKLFDPGTREHYGRMCRATQCQDILDQLTRRAK